MTARKASSARAFLGFVTSLRSLKIRNCPRTSTLSIVVSLRGSPEKTRRRRNDLPVGRPAVSLRVEQDLESPAGSTGSTIGLVRGLRRTGRFFVASVALVQLVKPEMPGQCRQTRFEGLDAHRIVGRLYPAAAQKGLRVSQDHHPV